MARLPWGYKSRHCVYCGRVRPRIQVAGGYAHKYCLPPDVLREHNRQMRRKTVGPDTHLASGEEKGTR